ncbi:MAG: hypothetical protein H8E91_05660 [Planctomycetes bacterium]|nr:hypothetical protein [Planctomycetota bacterium]
MHYARTLIFFLGLLPIFVSSTVFGQAMPMFNDPLKIREIERYAERLELTSPQKDGVLQAYDQYVVAYAKVRKGEIQKFEDFVTAFIENFGFMQFQIPEREDIHDLIAKGKRAMKSIDRVDNIFFDSILGMLTERQQRVLKRIRNERQLAAYRIIVLEMLSEFNKSSSPNITQLVQQVVKGESLETEASLELYEQKMVRHAEGSLEAMIKVIDQALDMVDEMGLRGMEREEMFMIFMDKEQLANLEAKGNILLAPLQKQAAEISELHWKTWKSIDSQIAEEYRRPLAMKYFRRGFWEPIRGYEKIDNRFRKALDMKLNEGQKQELLSLQKDYEDRSLSLATKYAKLLVQAWEKRTIEQQRKRTSPFDDRIAQADDDRKKLVDTTTARFEGILGSHLVAELDGKKRNEEKAENGMIKVTKEDGSVYYDDDPAVDKTKKVDAASKPIKVNLVGGVNIPKPMGSTFAKDIALQLGLGTEGEDIVNALFTDYREKYNAYYDTLKAECVTFDQNKSLGLGARLKKKQDLTNKAKEKVTDLEVAFFDDLAVVTGFERDDPLVQMLEQFRMRKRITSTGSRYGWGRSTDKVLDLVDVFVIDDEPLVLTENGKAILDKMMLEYQQQADVQFQEIVQAEYDMNHFSDAMMLASEFSKTPMNTTDMQKKWSDAFTAIRAAKQNLIRSNQVLVDTLLSEIPQEDYWTVRMHYVKVAYPNIFEDKGEVTTILEAASAIQSLDGAQQGEITRMQEQYRQQYWNLCESMIVMNEAAVLEESNGSMISQSAMKNKIDEEKLRFERSELNDRMRMRLRMVLSEDQIKHVPGLRPAVTASAEK